MKITRKDVARLAKVSETTVSFVLNNRQDIILAEDTRRRVLDAAKELGYVPNHAARSMAGKKSRTIGILSPWDAQVWFFSGMLNGILDAASESDYGILLCGMTEKHNGLQECVSYYREGRIDGIVYLPPATDQIPGLSDILSEGVPTVLCNGYSPDALTPYVVIDYASGIRKAVLHLHRKGFRRIVYILPDTETRLCAGDRDRVAGYDRAVLDLGLDNIKSIFNAGTDTQTKMALASQILDNCPAPTGLVSCYWEQAYFLQIMAEKRGLQFGQDVSVIAGDHPFFTHGLVPPLTGVDLPFYEIGRTSMEMMVRRLEATEGNSGSGADASMDSSPESHKIEGTYSFLSEEE